MAIKTKSYCGSSWFDADNWHRILVSKSLGSISLDAWKWFTNFVTTFASQTCIQQIMVSEVV